ncbi:aminoglycoside phosphotransferase family protein [Lentzea tibetensis]|uniref:Aminoglycoside phosphotransferase family protein n=1 Tax=Lentzea tibetensis TaxID=2591470 RepID=A0A563EG59_9PSEU|nr:aminoglycoside phosphotransferase family protein [Lentzea tibetensis]TWP45205.1 aminoglycoside phosphotransferase family protein [Lentzea tibetensis]
MERELLTGGGLNQVFKVGDAVHRPVASWTPRVHELLGVLAPLGFTPNVHGVQDGLEVLDFMPGEVGHPPLPPHLRGDDVLVEAARMLRQMHDASVGLVDRDGWQFERREPAEVICHGDFASYNIVFADGRPAGVIDFDTAHPAPRWWDVSYACMTFTLDFGTPAEQLRRMELFCVSYGCTTDGLIDQILVRLDDMVHMIRENPAFVIQRAEKHDEHYLRLTEYVQANLA